MANQDPPTQPSHLVRSPLEPAIKRTHTFVLRLVVDAQGDLRGVVSEPGSVDEWRSTVASLDQLLLCLNERLSL